MTAVADPLDAALQSIGLARDPRKLAELPEQLAAALECAALWHVVFDHAMSRGDADLAVVAFREWRHMHDVYRELVTLVDLPPPEISAT